MRSLRTFLRWWRPSPSPALGRTANEVIDEVLGDVRRRLEAVPCAERDRILILTTIAMVAFAKSKARRGEWEELEAGIMLGADAVAGRLSK
jgi:hypothetical protein